MASRWKRLEGLRVMGEFVRQELQSDVTAELYVLGFVHHSHATAAQLLNNAVVRDGLADHREASLPSCIILRMRPPLVNE